MDTDIPDTSQCSTLPPASPYARAKGLPYAPVDWPNPGDVWSWRVGKSVNNSGFFNDRVLIAPPRIWKQPNKQLCFPSLPSIERYLQAEHPDVAIGEFLTSFSWKIPAKAQFRNKGNFMLHPHKMGKFEADEVQRDGSEINTTETIAEFRRRNRHASKKSVLSSTKVARLTHCSTSKSSMMVKSDLPVETSNKVCHENLKYFNPRDTVNPTDSPTKKSQVEVEPDDFGSCLRYLDDLLNHHVEEARSFPPTAEDMVDARKQLSEILSKDLQVVFTSEELVSEIMALSNKLKNDSSLSASNSMLKLIEEVPVTSKVFKEAKKVQAQAEKFFSDLNANEALATNAKNDYIKLKEETADHQAKIESELSAIKIIDEQIANLQSLRAEQSASIENNKRKLDQVVSKRTTVVEGLPKVIHEIQLAQAHRSGWELKKKSAVEKKARILRKFSPIQGLSF